MKPRQRPWCPGPESNRHAFRRGILSPTPKWLNHTGCSPVFVASLGYLLGDFSLLGCVYATTIFLCGFEVLGSHGVIDLVSLEQLWH